MNFSYQPYDPPDYQRDQVIGASPLPEWDVLGTTAQDSWVHNPTQAISDTADYYLAQHPEWRQPVASVAGALTGIPGVGGLAAPFQMAADKAITTPPSADAFVDAHTLNQQYGQTLGLSFDKPMRQGAVDILTRQKKAQLQRDYTLSHGPGGFWNGAASFGTQLAVSATDPLNIAAAFVPVVGEVRAGLWAERVGATAARVGEGAIEGAVGTAAIQPIEAARDQAFQQEYGPMDAFMNVAFGSVLGGGLHAGLGKVSDFLGRLHPETREGALRGAVGQMAEGRPVDVEAAVKSDPAYATATEPAPLTSMPVIDQQGLELSARQSKLQSDISTLQDNLSKLPQGDQVASDALTRLQAVEQRLASSDLNPAERKALTTRRDELLTSTTPEALQASAAPIEQRRNIQNQIDSSKKELADVRHQKNSRAIDTLVQRLSPEAQQRLQSYGFEPTKLDTGSQPEAPRGIQAPDAGQAPQPGGLGGGEGTPPAATGGRAAPQDFNAALDRTRTAAQDFAAHKEDSSLVPPGASEQAAQEVASGKGDNIDEEIDQAERTLDQYKTNGVVSEDEAKAHSDATAADTEKANTQGEAARAASACLFLHP